MDIIAIGGGSLKKKQTLPLDRYIVKLTGRKRPRALFVPTASNDLPEYCEAFDRIYGSLLGCTTDHLLLYGRKGDRRAAAGKIKAADLIYVGGGNTLRMMRIWRRFGIDRMLIRVACRGTVMAGLSAGALCWHAWGHSDSRSYSGKNNWSYIKVRCLGLRPGLYCPHLDSEKRHASFRKMVLRDRMTGIACDNFAAVHYTDAGARCITSRKKAMVHIYTLTQRRITIRSYKGGDVIEVPCSIR
ncbi:MAG TPA: peptidase E [Nitrospirota bacterium]|nr:peptidase E [Nitrospirota bacterium]